MLQKTAHSFLPRLVGPALAEVLSLQRRADEPDKILVAQRRSEGTADAGGFKGLQDGLHLGRLDCRTGREMVYDGSDPVFQSEEHTSELQSQSNLVCRLLLEKKK